ncbi:MAG: TIR domain-containing protein [Pseudomonadota bacterium]
MSDGRVFISYRRGVDSAFAGRLHDRLERHFSRDQLFMDVDSIPLSRDFVDHLDEQVGKCSVFLAIIGPGWLDARGRLEDPDDFVRIEIECALRRPDIPIIPVFVEDVVLPESDNLPASLAPLTRRNGIVVSHHSFAAVVDNKLTTALTALMPAGASAGQRDAVRSDDGLDLEALVERSDGTAASLPSAFESTTAELPGRQATPATPANTQDTPARPGNQRKGLIAAVAVCGLIALGVGAFLALPLTKPALDDPIEADQSAQDLVRLALNGGDAVAGRAAYRACVGCHNAWMPQQGVGPNLVGIVGRQIASIPQLFRYSDAMLALEGVWTPEALNAYLANPKEWLPGTRMLYRGMPDPVDRANLIAFLATTGVVPGSDAEALDEPVSGEPVQVVLGFKVIEEEARAEWARLRKALAIQLRDKVGRIVQTRWGYSVRAEPFPNEKSAISFCAQIDRAKFECDVTRAR